MFVNFGVSVYCFVQLRLHVTNFTPTCSFLQSTVFGKLVNANISAAPHSLRSTFYESGSTKLFICFSVSNGSIDFQIIIFVIDVWPNKLTNTLKNKCSVIVATSLCHSVKENRRQSRNLFVRENFNLRFPLASARIEQSLSICRHWFSLKKKLVLEIFVLKKTE